MSERHRAAYGAYAYLTELAYTLDADPAFAALMRDRWPESWAAIDAACKALYHAALTVRSERDGAIRRRKTGILAPLRRWLTRRTP